jgi:hypothetical protein
VVFYAGNIYYTLFFFLLSPSSNNPSRLARENGVARAQLAELSRRDSDTHALGNEKISEVQTHMTGPISIEKNATNNKTIASMHSFRLMTWHASWFSNRDHSGYEYCTKNKR